MLGGVLTDTRLRSMLERGYDAAMKDKASNTALHCAARRGNEEGLSALMKSFDARDSENNDYMRPADIAISRGFDELAKFLLGRDDAEAFSKRCRYRNLHEKSILHWAVTGNYES